MTKPLPLLCLCLALPAAGSPLADRLIAYYSFEETGANGLQNQAPGATGLHAARHGGGAFDASANPSGPGFAGKADFNPGNGASDRSVLLAGKALNLVDTRSDAISVPLGTSQLGRNFTIAVWHALTPSGGSVARPFVFEPGDANYNVSWGIGSGDNYTAYVTQASSLAGGTLARGVWHHVAHVFSSDGTTTTLRLYVNGSFAGERTGLTSAMAFTSLNFGKHRGTGFERAWDGLMDELAVWGRALTAAEVRQVWRRGRDGLPLATLPEPAETIRLARLDPYRGVDWDAAGQRKGNLHTHTTRSDGQMDPAAVMDLYQQNGYEVLAITDHNLNTWPWSTWGRDPAAMGLTAIPGNEASRHHHANSLFCTYNTSVTVLDDSIAAVAALQGLVQLNHPAMHWPSTYPRTTAEVRAPLGTGLEQVTRGDLTLETWFRTTDEGRGILAGNYSVSHQGALNLELHTDNRVRVYCQPRSGTTVDLNVSATPLGINTRDGAWHHLAAVRTQGWWRLYLDGRLAGRVEDATATHPRSRVRPAISDRTFPLRPETLALAAAAGGPELPQRASFGVLSDLHYGYFPRALSFLQAFMDDMNATPPDFLIQLGDFCKPSDGQPALDLWNTFAGPRHHVLGNHDMDGGATADQSAAFLGMPARYYAFDAGRVRGLVLDGNEAGGAATGYKRFVGADQRAWLAQRLAEADRPVILFIHQPPDDPNRNGLENGADILNLVAAANQTRPGLVIAVFSGHLHNDYALLYDGVPHIQINSASYLWYDPMGRVEYNAPLWGRVTVDFAEGTLRLAGRTAGWESADPWSGGAADGAFDLNGASWYLGRDTRTDTTRLDGALDETRLWTSDLGPAEIEALAGGGAPRDLAAAANLLAEYRYETSGGTPLEPAPSFTGAVDDTAARPSGPFPATATGGESLAVISQTPPALQAAGRSARALEFREAGGVPPAAATYYRDLFVRHPVLYGMEILNATRPLDEYPLDRQLWDALLGDLMPFRPVWGAATDDMHSLAHFGKDWYVFLTPVRDEASIRRAIHDGAYYFSSARLKPAGSVSTDPPPRIDRILHDRVAGRIELRASVNGTPVPAADIRWISHGETVHTGAVLDYRATGPLTAGARYVRAEITGAGGTTFTNPFGFVPEDTRRDSDEDGLPDWWEEVHFDDPMSALPNTPAPGGSGMDLGQHFIVGTDPRDPAGAFVARADAVAPGTPNRWRLRWASVAGRIYAIGHGVDPAGAFTPLPGAGAIPATPPENVYELDLPEHLTLYRLSVRLAN